jgi:hypothetical protein
MTSITPRFRVRNNVALSNNDVYSSRPCYPGQVALASPSVSLPDNIKGGDKSRRPIMTFPLRPGMFNRLIIRRISQSSSHRALDLDPSPASDANFQEYGSFSVTFTCMGGKYRIFQSNNLARVFSATTPFLPPVDKVTLRKSLVEDNDDENISLLDLKLGGNAEKNADFVTLDFQTGAVSTSLDEKKSLDLKERLDACNDRAVKLQEIQSSLNMAWEEGDVMIMKGELGPDEIEDWKRLIESDEDHLREEKFEDISKRLGEAKENFAASMDKLSEELAMLKMID